MCYLQAPLRNTYHYIDLTILNVNDQVYKTKYLCIFFDKTTQSTPTVLTSLNIHLLFFKSMSILQLSDLSNTTLLATCSRNITPLLFQPLISLQLTLWIPQHNINPLPAFSCSKALKFRIASQNIKEHQDVSTSFREH